MPATVKEISAKLEVSPLLAALLGAQAALEAFSNAAIMHLTNLPQYKQNIEDRLEGAKFFTDSSSIMKMIDATRAWVAKIDPFDLKSEYLVNAQVFMHETVKMVYEDERATLNVENLLRQDRKGGPGQMIPT